MTEVKREYRKKDFYWGERHDLVAEKVLYYVSSGRLLDIGAGEGRNSVFFAKKGFEVYAVDILKEGVEKIQQFAKKEGVRVNVEAVNICGFEFFKREYNVIFSSGMFHFLKFSDFLEISQRIKEALALKGVICLSVFSNKDPSFGKLASRGFKEIEENTFYHEKKKIYRHFFTKKEIENIFSEFEIKHLEEKIVKDVLHGKREHTHSVIEMIVVKKN